MFTPADSVNYQTVETTMTVKVNKAQNPTNMPGSSMNVANRLTKVSEVTLPEGWEWQSADKDTALEVGKTITATAVYTGADKGNYEKESVTISITRSKCDHTNTEVRNAKTATCLEKGYTGDVYCTDCKEMVTQGTEIPLADHIGGTAACTEKAQCSVCGQKYGTIDSSNHLHTEYRGKVPAACTAEGYTGDIYCKDCGVKTGTGKTTAALGHQYSITVTRQPTTSREGIRTYTCTRSGCGHSYTTAIARLTATETPEENKPDTGATGTPEENRPDTGAAGTPEENRPDTGAAGTPEESRPDTGMPFVKDNTEKSGWDIIREDIEAAGDGESITVDMNGSTIVPGDVLDDIKGRDVTIILDLGNGIIWSVNGQSITMDSVGDIDFAVSTGTNSIPVDIINGVTGENYSIQISLAYEGEFGFTAVLRINLEEKNAGLYANLYYYNENTGEMEFICADEIAEDGSVNLTFTHASDYAIVIDDKPATEGSEETETATIPKQEGENKEQPENEIWKPFWIILLGAVVLLIGLGGVVVLKEKKKDKGGDERNA